MLVQPHVFVRHKRFCDGHLASAAAPSRSDGVTCRGPVALTRNCATASFRKSPRSQSGQHPSLIWVGSSANPRPKF